MGLSLWCSWGLAPPIPNIYSCPGLALQEGLPYLLRGGFPQSSDRKVLLPPHPHPPLQVRHPNTPCHSDSPPTHLWSLALNLSLAHSRDSQTGLNAFLFSRVLLFPLHSWQEEGWRKENVPVSWEGWGFPEGRRDCTQDLCGGGRVHALMVISQGRGRPMLGVLRHLPSAWLRSLRG